MHTQNKKKAHFANADFVVQLAASKNHTQQDAFTKRISYSL